MFKHILLTACLLAATVMLPGLSYGDDAGLSAEVQTVNINEADAETLSRQLVGVGRSRAAAIVRYREEFGPYHTVEDLLEVKGIGKATLERNRPRITLD